MAKSVAMALEQAEAASADAASSSSQVPDAIVINPPDALDRTLEEAVERAFISPRVVDQAAFDSLAGTLRKLTTDAQTQARTLSTTSVQMGHMQESVRGLIKDLQGRIDGALKALPTLDTRISRTQALLDRVSNETALTKARELRDTILREVAQQRDAIVQEAIQTALDGARERLTSDLSTIVRDALDQSRADAILAARDQRRLTEEPAPAMLATANATLDPAMLASIEQRLTQTASKAISTQLDMLTLRAREALHELESGMSRLEARILAIQSETDLGMDRAELAKKRLEEALIRAELRLRTASDDAERRTEAVATEIAEQLLAVRTDAGRIVNAGREQLASESDQLKHALREQMVQAVEREVLSRLPALMETREAAPRSAAMVGNEQSSQVPASQVASDFARLDAARQDIKGLLHRLDAARTGVDQAVARSDDHTLASAAAMDMMEERAARLRQQAEGRTPERAPIENPSLLSLQQVHLQAQLEARQQAMQMQQLTAQAMQVGQWLSQLVQHAQQLSQTSLKAQISR